MKHRYTVLQYKSDTALKFLVVETSDKTHALYGLQTLENCHRFLRGLHAKKYILDDFTSHTVFDVPYLPNVGKEKSWFSDYAESLREFHLKFPGQSITVYNEYEIDHCIINRWLKISLKTKNDNFIVSVSYYDAWSSSYGLDCEFSLEEGARFNKSKLSLEERKCLQILYMYSSKLETELFKLMSKNG